MLKRGISGQALGKLGDYHAVVHRKLCVVDVQAALLGLDCGYLAKGRHCPKHPEYKVKDKLSHPLFNGW